VCVWRGGVLCCVCCAGLMMMLMPPCSNNLEACTACPLVHPAPLTSCRVVPCTLRQPGVAQHLEDRGEERLSQASICHAALSELPCRGWPNPHCRG
jgi:hypothetical protein